MVRLLQGDAVVYYGVSQRYPNRFSLFFSLLSWLDVVCKSLVSFLGVNDGENSFTQAGNNYVGQRQAFLLGSKIDTELGFPSPVPFSDPSIQILVYLRDVRAKAKWLQ